MPLLIVFILCLGVTRAEEVRVDTFMLPMRDGVKLATDMYGPLREGRYPVLVTRSPYNKNGERKRGEFFAAHGYGFLAQDCGGRWASEGTLYPLVNEGRAAAQAWSNGLVGTTGGSGGMIPTTARSGWPELLQNSLENLYARAVGCSRMTRCPNRSSRRTSERCSVSA